MKGKAPMADLYRLGWNEHFSSALSGLGTEEVVPGRVSWQSAFDYQVMCGSEVLDAGVTGKVRDTGVPAVGDWVALRREAEGGNAIVAVLPRTTVFSRSAAGKTTSEQVVAANVTCIFVVTDPGRDFNLRRIERYMTLVYNSGASPVLIVNKADQAEDMAGVVAEAETAAPGVPLHAVSALTGEGTDVLKQVPGVGTDHRLSRGPPAWENPPSSTSSWGRIVSG